MGQTLGKLGAMPLTLEGVGLGAAIVTFLIFLVIWGQDAKKRGGKKPAAGRWLNAAGFALLPAVAIWKVFEDHGAGGMGRPVEEPFPTIAWITREGRWLPARMEAALALLCFLGVCLWLILRKKELPGNGDLLLVVLCVWGAVRAVTESFREGALLFPGFLEIVAVSMMLLPLIFWEIRRIRQQKAAQQVVLDGIGAAGCAAVLLLASRGVLPLGSGIARMAVIFGCAALLCVITLLAGKDTRD